MHLSFFNNSRFQWFFIKIINFYLMSHYYLLKDDEDYSYLRTVICIILYSGNCLLYIIIYHITLQMCQKITTEIFVLMSPIYIVVYECLDETSLVEIKVKIHQVINILIYFLDRICQVNWYRTNKKGWTARAYTTVQVSILFKSEYLPFVPFQHKIQENFVITKSMNFFKRWL